MADELGLYFVGLKFRYVVSSDVITGVDRDAEYVAKHIAARRSSRQQPVLEETVA